MGRYIDYMQLILWVFFFGFLAAGIAVLFWR
jgi:hypothetical protein